MKIHNLKQKKQLAGQVIRYMWEEWGAENNFNFIERLVESIIESNREDMPQIYIAVEKGNLVGFAALLTNDLKNRQDLFPWLACVYVKKESRGRDLGRKLESYALQKAREMGYGKIYLVTKLENYYEKSGWKFIGNEPMIPGDLIKVYGKDL